MDQAAPCVVGKNLCSDWLVMHIYTYVLQPVNWGNTIYVRAAEGSDVFVMGST